MTILTVAIFACVSGQRTSYLFLSFFFYCPPKKIRPGKAEENEKASSLFRLRQLTIAKKMNEKMRASKTECGREASGNEIEVCTFPVTHVYT